jgi:mannose-6-phosphate isomerase class I
VSDLGRGRETQPEVAAEIAAYGVTAAGPTEPIDFEAAPGARRTHLVANRMFALDRLDLEPGAEATLAPDPGSYRVVSAIEGSGEFRAAGGGAAASFERGGTYLVPAEAAEWRVGAASKTALVTGSVPDLDALGRELRDRGFSAERIAGLDGRCYTNDFEPPA